MGTTGAAARTPSVARPTRPARPKAAPAKSSKPASKAKARPNPRAEAKLFGKAMLVILIIGACLTAVLVQRIAIMHTLYESDAIEDQIDKEVLIRDNLEARIASLAASPGIQRRASKSIGMVPAQDVDFITAEKKMRSGTLAADMRYFDRSSSKLKHYRAQLAHKAAAKKSKALGGKTVADSRTDVQGATIKVQSAPDLQANRPAGQNSAGQ